MFVKNLPGQIRHCGSLPPHERSHDPDKEAGEETNDRMTGRRRPCATKINTWLLVCLCSVAFCRGVGSWDE